MATTFALLAVLGFFLSAHLLLKNQMLRQELEFFNLDSVEKILIIKDESTLLEEKIDKTIEVDYVLSKNKKTLKINLRTSQEDII